MRRRRVRSFWLLCVLAVLALVLLGPLLAPHAATAPVGPPFQPPSVRFPLGTDVVGRDVMSRLLHGGLPLLSLAGLALLVAYALGLGLGLLAGLRRALDGWIARPVDAIVVIPWFLLLAVIATVLGAGPVAIVVTVALASVPWIIRIVRACVLELAGTGYVESARARGEPLWRLALLEVLPNLRSVVLADAGVRISASISMVAVSGFLGLGLRPPSPDWALMITENRPGFGVQPWAVLAPALLIMVLVVSVNMVTDRALRPDRPTRAPRPGRRGTGLSAEALTVRDARGTVVLEEVSFALAPGSGLAVIGASGAGKSTLALALLGGLPPGLRMSGNVDLGASPGRRAVGYVPQDPASGLNPALRIGTAIREIARAQGLPGTNAQIHAALCDVDLPADRAFQRRYPHELSGGQQQRVLLAMALLGDPALLVLDEPTTGLDPRTRDRFLETLHRLRRTTTTILLVITHDLEPLAPLVDQVLELEDGRRKALRPSPARSAAVGRDSAAEAAELVAAAQTPLDEKQCAAESSEVPGGKQCAAKSSEVPDGVGSPSVARTESGASVEPNPVGAPAGPVAASCAVPDSAVRTSSPALRLFDAVVEQRSSRAVGVAESAPTAPVPRAAGVPVLRVSGLTVGHAARPVVAELSFELWPGQCLAVTGRSGIGKTTVARALAGLHRPERGVIELAGEEVAGMVDRRSREQRRALQLVFQNPATSLNPSYRVGAQVRRPLRLLRGLGEADAGRRAAELLADVGLDDELALRRPGQLSGGQQQRVAIARALAAGPGVLLCDEVTSSLDPRNQELVLDLLDRLRRAGLALIVISHQQAVLDRLADRVLRLDDEPMIAKR
ncbi:ATP-binding cassette domain-containing protein [Nocardia sp. NPDC048505]|uniref:ABC transporter ATP-binding protein/permease n=1 Tax=unclassified Nocardia TaxID=2637762 RepID=UPI0033E40096